MQPLRIDDAIPAWPETPDTQRGRGRLHVRYEDVVQDGRFAARPMTHAIGAALWRDALARHPLVKVMEPTGIVPVLSRLVASAGGGPIGVRSEVSCEGVFDLARAVDDTGKARFYVDMWARATGSRDRTWGPVEGKGEPVPLGEVYAEHTMTRLFAAPSERVVSELPAELHGLVRVTERAHSAPLARVALPAGASWIDDGWSIDPCPIVFGLGHTDSNQHVNSLVYPLLLEEAALRRLDALGMKTDRFAGGLDIGFRKPCFAGERVRIVVRAYRRGEAIGVAGAFVPAATASASAPDARAHAYGRVELVS